MPAADRRPMHDTAEHLRRLLQVPPDLLKEPLQGPTLLPGRLAELAEGDTGGLLHGLLGHLAPRSRCPGHPAAFQLSIRRSRSRWSNSSFLASPPSWRGI